MPIADSIQEARRRGASDDVILQKILEQNPAKAGVIQTAQQRGADSSSIVEEILKQNESVAPVQEEKTPGFFTRAAKGIGGFLSDISGISGTSKAINAAVIAPGETADVEMLNQQAMDLIKKAQGLPIGNSSRRRLFEQAIKLSQTAGGTAEEITTAMPTRKEALGSITKLGINVATIGAGQALSTPLRAGFGGALKGGAIAFGKGATVGGALGFAEGLEHGKSIEEAARGSITPALAGGVINAGFHVGSQIFRHLTEVTPGKLYKNALGQSSKDLLKEIKGQSPELSQQLLDRGIRGSGNKVLSEAITGIKTAEDKIDEILASEIGQQTIKTNGIARSLDEITRQYRNVLGDEGAAAIESVRSNISGRGRTITLADALQLKRDIYDVLAESAFNPNANLTQKTEALRTVASSLRKAIGETSPTLKKLTEDQQLWIRTAQSMEGMLSRGGKKNLIGLSDVILGSAGLGAVDLTKIIGRRAIETPGFKTTAAVGLDRLGKFIQKMPTDKAGRISKTVVMDLVGRWNR